MSLKQNGIESRHYAIDRRAADRCIERRDGRAAACGDAVDRGRSDIAAIDFLAAATSQGDLPVPGFASMVHAELGAPPCEIATTRRMRERRHGVKNGILQVQAGGKRLAVACASEFASRLFKASRFEASRRLWTRA